MSAPASPSSPSSSPGRRLLGAVGNAVAVAGVVFVVRALVTRVDALPPLVVSKALMGAFVGGVLVQLAAVLLATTTWQALLRGAGVRHPWRDCFRALGGSAVAKYVPGNVFHLVGRAAMATREGVPAAAVVGTLALEAALVLLTAFAVGWPALLARVDELRALAPGPGPLLAVGGAAVVALAALGLAGRRALLRRDARTSARALVVALLGNAVTFVLLGLAMAASLAAVLPAAGPGAEELDGLALTMSCVPAFAVAWALGFVVPGAPGGIGVREAAFVLLLPLHGEVIRAAVVVALVLGRLQSVVADIVVFAVARALPAPSSSSSS